MNVDRRRVAFIVHNYREEAVDAAVEFVEGMKAYGIECLGLGERAIDVRERTKHVRLIDADELSDDVEVLVVFGGDGTILAAAESAIPHGVPLLGVNLGHVGFLAELDRSHLPQLVTQVAERDYFVEKRLTLKVEVRDLEGQLVWESMAVNEASIEKFAREKMLDLMIEVDHRPLYRFGCDGLLVSTPSGSTAYAFSIGGPVVWPDVEAFLVVPKAAHALFARPMVLAPNSVVDVRVGDQLGSHMMLWCDGRRSVELDQSAHIHVERGQSPFLVARLSEQPFTSRLVKKFRLNVEGIRQQS